MEFQNQNLLLYRVTLAKMVIWLMCVCMCALGSSLKQIPASQIF